MFGILVSGCGDRRSYFIWYNGDHRDENSILSIKNNTCLGATRYIPLK